MAWDGNGNYVLSPTYYPEVNGTVIDAVRYNGLMTDLQTALNNAVCKDGQNAVEANLSMGGFKLTSLAAATVAGDATRFEQVLRNGTAGLAAASTTELGASAVSTLSITGTTTITSFGATAETGQIKWLVFASATPITHNATSMIIPGGASLTMAVGDVVAVVHLGSGNWKWLTYLPAALAIPFPDGTVSAPSIKFASDLGTGFYRYAANTLGVAAGGVLGMSIAYKDVTECTGAFKGDLDVTGTLTVGSFSPTSLSVTGNLTANSAAGYAISLKTRDYISGENASAGNIEIIAGSANSFASSGGSVTIAAGYNGNTNPSGTLSLYTKDSPNSNGMSGNVQIYTGDSEGLTGSLSVWTGNCTDAGSGSISIATGEVTAASATAGDVTLWTSADGSNNPERTGSIILKNNTAAVLTVENGAVKISGGSLVTWGTPSGAGSGATVSGGRSKFVITCGSGASATFTVEDTNDLMGTVPFYYWSGGVAAPRPVYGGLTDSASVFTFVLPVAPSSGHKIYVYCLG